MCGIAGILRVHPPGAAVPPHEVAIPEAWLDILDASIKHRGPDGQGRFRDRAVRPDGTVVDVALVHRRLSILDHAGGAQPMVSRRDSRAATRDSGDVAGGEAKDHGGATFQGLALPVLFHGKPNDVVRYRMIGEVGGHSLARRAPEDGSDLVAVVFNGCIYNHRELRKELQAAGHRFVSDHSDTEVLVHGWREWGISSLAKADGMFAVAVWDARRGVVVLARDLAGEKPLYFHRPQVREGHWLVFGSQATSVLALSEAISPDPWPVMKRTYEERVGALRACGAQPELPVQIKKSGKILLDIPVTTVDIGGAEIQHYEHLLANPIKAPRHIQIRDWISKGWCEYPPQSGVHEASPGWYAASQPFDKHDWSDRFRGPTSQGIGDKPNMRLTPEITDDLLNKSVRCRLQADVPIACFLSGGIDSGLVAAMAKRSLAESGANLLTLTMRMPSAEFDESAAAERTAKHIGSRHVTLDCSPNPAEDLIQLIEQLGLPSGDSSLLPTYWLCKAARAHVQVALSGDGGDELFAGYERHRAIPIIRKHGHLIRRIPEWIALLLGRRRKEIFRRLILACHYGGYDDIVNIFDGVDWRGLTGHRAFSCSPSSFQYTHLSSDFQKYLPFDLLRKSDTASMAVALEVRAPFLDPYLIRCASGTPLDVLMPHGQRKGLLRQLARKYLPAEIVDRPKMGFAIPIGEWFRTDYGGMKTLLMDTLNSADPFPASTLGLELNRAFIAKMVDEHMSGTRDHSQRLYMLLVLGIWVKTL